MMNTFVSITLPLLRFRSLLAEGHRKSKANLSIGKKRLIDPFHTEKVDRIL